MGQNYLTDTNGVIDYLNNKLPESANALLDNNTPQISVITRIELLAWSGINTEQIKILNQHINASIVWGLDEEVIEETIRIRKHYGVKLPDSIIAATALIHNLTLLTRNIKDFHKISGLTVINPHLL